MCSIAIQGMFEEPYFDIVMNSRVRQPHSRTVVVFRPDIQSSTPELAVIYAPCSHSQYVSRLILRCLIRIINLFYVLYAAETVSTTDDLAFFDHF